MSHGRFTILVIAMAAVAIVAVTGVGIGDITGGDDDEEGPAGPGRRDTAPERPAREPASEPAPAREPEPKKAAARPRPRVPDDPEAVLGNQEIALVRPRNLERALAVLERERRRAEGVFDGLRIAPGRIDTQVRRSNRIINLQIRADFKIPFRNEIEFPTQRRILERGLRGRDVNPRVPARLLRAIDARRRGSTAARDVDYLVVRKDIIEGDVYWSAFLQSGPEPRAWSFTGPDLAPRAIG